MSRQYIAQAELKVRLLHMIGAQEDAAIFRWVEQLLEEEEAVGQLSARVSEGENAISEGRYKQPDEARSLVRERMARKFGK